MLKRRIVRYWTTIKDICKKHKKTALAILLIIAVAAGGSVGYKLMTATDSGVASSEKKLEQAKEAEEEAISEEKKAEEELEKAKESGDKEAVKEAEKEVEKAKEKVKASNSNSSSNSSSHKSNSGTSNKGSYSKPSNSGSSSTNKPSKPSSGNSGSSGSSSSSSKPSKPAHQHNWQPIYDYDYANAYEECKKCGAILSDMSKEQLRLHLKECGGSSELKYPTIIVGYQCHSCGATK